MTLFYIANVRMPTEKAHGIQIVKMCEAFAKTGAAVRLIVPERKSHVTKTAFEFYGVPKSFEIVFLPTIDLIRWSRFIPKVFSFLQNYTFARSVKKYLAGAQPDLIYTRDELSAKMAPPGQPMILEVHNTSRILKAGADFFNKRLVHLVVITQGLKDELQKLGYDSGKIKVFADGVDMEEFKNQKSKIKNREELGLPVDKKIVMYTGNFMQWKGTNTLALASRHFADDCMFVYAGGSPFELENFKTFLSRNSLTEKNRLLGHVPHNLVPRHLAAADVLVLPNSGHLAISKFFTSPLKLFEYMASGNPVVASALPSIQEILNDSNSVLVAPDDEAALAAGIKTVLDDPALAKRLGDQAASDVQKYDWRKRAEKILELL